MLPLKGTVPVNRPDLFNFFQQVSDEVFTVGTTLLSFTLQSFLSVKYVF